MNKTDRDVVRLDFIYGYASSPERHSRAEALRTQLAIIMRLVDRPNIHATTTWDTFRAHVKFIRTFPQDQRGIQQELVYHHQFDLTNAEVVSTIAEVVGRAIQELDDATPNDA